MASSLTLCIIARLFVFQFSQQYAQGQSPQVTLTNNGYKGVVVAIAPHINHTDGEPLIEKIKQLFTSGSEVLYRATRLRAFFEEVTILVPQSWPGKPEYAIAGSENFGLADVRIDDPHPERGDEPYTLQPLGCGSPGLFIHLTPGYLQNLDTNSTYEWGDPGKVLVHEWAHLRYGIFDEYGYNDDPMYPVYYYEDGKLVPNACTNQVIEGEFWDLRHNKACTFDSDEIPDECCVYRPNMEKNDDIASSLNSYHFLKNVETFCDDTHTYIHNKRAPNKQNILCEGRSSWNIIEQHPDFAEGRNPPNDIGNIIPNFTIVQQMEATYSLVLDISGSMSIISGRSLQRKQILYEAVKQWLQEEIELGVAVGIIVFDTFASVVYPIQKIDTEEKRNEIISKIPNESGASTCIGCGLRLAVEELQRYRKAPGGIIVLVTDGQETHGPFIQEVIPDLVKTKTRVIAIALHTQDNANLEIVVKATGGKIFSIPPGFGIEKLEMAFFKALAFQDSDLYHALKVHSAKIVVTSEYYTGNFSIDATIGNDTTVGFFTANANDIIDITITADGFTAPISSALREERLISFKFPMLNPGKYTYTITRERGNKASEIHSTVTSKARSRNSRPIVSKCRIQEESMSTAVQPRFVILIEVKQGNNPVVNATVTVQVDRPRKNSIMFQLLDNGSGAPDVTKHDGIYSGYFTRYVGKGRYSVSAHITDDGKAAIREVGRTGFRVMQVPHGCPGNNKVTETGTGEFERENECGVITITNEINEEKEDLFPPSRVADLRVASVPDDETEVFLQWTAPGDDLDTGNVSSYDIRYSHNWTELATDFPRSHRLNITSTPRPAGEQEKYILTIPNPNKKVSIFFALQASDEAGHTSKPSNIGQFLKKRDSFHKAALREDVNKATTTAPPPTISGDSNRKITTGDSNMKITTADSNMKITTADSNMKITPGDSNTKIPLGDAKMKITITNMHKFVIEGKWIPQWLRDVIKTNANAVYSGK